MDRTTQADAYVLHEGEAELRWMSGSSTWFLATGASTGGEFALVDERAPRGMDVPLHRHAADVESFYVLEGEVRFFLGEGPGELVRAGGFVHVPAGAAHGFRVESATARYLMLTTPHHGEFYRAITVPARADGSEPEHDVNLDEAIERYGIEWVDQDAARS